MPTNHRRDMQASTDNVPSSRDQTLTKRRSNVWTTNSSMATESAKQGELHINITSNLCSTVDRVKAPYEVVSSPFSVYFLVAPIP